MPEMVIRAFVEASRSRSPDATIDRMAGRPVFDAIERENFAVSKTSLAQMPRPFSVNGRRMTSLRIWSYGERDILAGPGPSFREHGLALLSSDGST